MPQVKFTRSKGLVQSTQSGLNGVQLENNSGTTTEIVHFSQGAASGIGFHRVSCIVPVAAQTTVDDAVAARVPWYVPSEAGTTVTFAMIAAEALDSSADLSLALEIHTADVAVGVASAGTEIVGADAAGNASKPDLDLNLGTGDSTGVVITSGTLANSNTAAATYFQLVCKETGAAINGEGKVLVVIEYYGAAPAAL